MVRVYSFLKRFDAKKSQLKKIAEEALWHKKKRLNVDVYLITNQQMKDLNYRFRHKNKSTNVLAFGEPLNEIYLAPDYIRTQKEDLNFLLIHGLLHLLGYNHKKKNDMIKMEKEEQKIIALIYGKNHYRTRHRNDAN